VDKNDQGIDMPEIDPSKVVQVFEYLLGPRLGRLIATLLLAAIVLFILFWCFSGVWEHGGRDIYVALNGISLPHAPDILKSNNVEASISALMLILVLYSAIIVAILYFLGKKLFKKNVSQSALDTLAELRNEGIDTVYAVKISSQQEFDNWKLKKQAWEEKLRTYIKNNFPKADYLYASHLGVVPFQNFMNAFNDEHLREVCFVIRQMDIIEQILNNYRR
jgi:hypothetical protein